jgi:hypothetical protein
MPPLVWTGAYRENNQMIDFNLTEFHCQQGAWMGFETIHFIMGTGWCPYCPDYMRAAANQAAQIEMSNGLVVYAELENSSRRAETNTAANTYVNRLIGTQPGVRLGDGSSMPPRTLINAPLVDAFPTGFVVRRSDMKIIATQASSNSRLPYLEIARNPMADWSNGQAPPAFRNNCGPSDEEVYEPNDSAATAALIQPGTFNGGVCTAAADYYRIDIPGAWRLDLAFRHSVGDIDVYVWDTARNDVARNAQNQKLGSDSGDDDESFTHTGPATVMVFGYRNASSPYTLTLTATP